MRRIPAIILAIVVAVGLFWLMNKLILTPGDRLEKVEELGNLNFIEPPPQTTETPRDRKKPPKPPPPKRPPPPPQITTASQPKPQQQPPQMNLPNLNLPTGLAGGPSLGGFDPNAVRPGQNSEAIPIYRHPPTYPRRAARNGTSGQVTMSVTINPDGTVSDIQIVSAQPRGMFEAAAVAAMQKWKFKPLIVNGTPIEQKATQTMDFTLN